MKAESIIENYLRIAKQGIRAATGLCVDVHCEIRPVSLAVEHTPDHIAKVVIESTCKITGVGRINLLSSSREGEVAKARHICMLVMRMYDMEDKYIGRKLCRDRSTVSTGCKAAQGHLDTDTTYANTVDAVLLEVEERLK